MGASAALQRWGHRWGHLALAVAVVLSHSAADICLASTLVGGGASTGPLCVLRLRGGGTNGDAGAVPARPSTVGVGIGLSKSAASGHVVRRLAPGFSAAQSGRISIKVGFLFFGARRICPRDDRRMSSLAGHHRRHRRRGGQKPQLEQCEGILACDVRSEHAFKSIADKHARLK